MKKANAPAPADVQVLLPAAMMNGKAVVDSREVARMLGRPHKNLLADIHRYISAMERRKADGLNFQPVARDFQLVDFFVPSTYTNDHNQTFPCYLLTQKGCEMVANKLTGEKGILFTAAYVNAFHALQEQAQAGAMVQLVKDGGGEANIVRFPESRHEIFSMPNSTYKPYLEKILGFYDDPMIACAAY